MIVAARAPLGSDALVRAQALRRIGNNMSNAPVLMQDWNVAPQAPTQGFSMSLASAPEKRETAASLGASQTGLAASVANRDRLALSTRPRA
jgi:hypothetical protein